MGRRRPRGKKKGGPFGPRIPEILELKRSRPVGLLLRGLLGRLLRGLLRGLLGSLLRRHGSVTSSWQIRLTVPKAACYVDLPSKDGGPRPSALSTACQSLEVRVQVLPFAGEVSAIASPALFFSDDDCRRTRTGCKDFFLDARDFLRTSTSRVRRSARIARDARRGSHSRRVASNG